MLVKQGALEKVYSKVANSRDGYGFNPGPSLMSKSITIDTGKPGFKDGVAQLIVEVSDFSFGGFFKGNNTRFVRDITIDTTPPRINILQSVRYIRPGGAGVVTYQVSGDTRTHGVHLNDTFFPGFPLAQGPKQTFIAYVSLSHDTSKIERAAVIATDPAGNSTSTTFTPVLKRARTKQDRINVGDSFVSKQIPGMEALYPEMEGSLLEKYLYINRTVREQNNAFIKKLCSTTLEDRLWAGRFLRMAGSSRAEFADHRYYYYQNKAIDEQIHLGVDIASTKMAEVRAANKGKVVYADYLGIYGNTIVLDHGQGVFSLYSHLTQIDVNCGDIIDKDKRLGRTGTTGMSGGDHLHFSILVNGIFVTPVEWWDSHWILVNIDEVISRSISKHQIQR